MIDRKRYCETFSRVRVSPETRRRILSMEQTTPKSVRRLAVAVAAVLAVTLSATAVVTFGGTMTVCAGVGRTHWRRAERGTDCGD